MLKISLDVKNAPPFADEENVISASGGLADIAAEMLYAIGNVYNTLKNRDPLAADIFRSMLVRGLNPSSPTWEPTPSVGIITVTEKKEGGPDHG